MCKQVSHRLMDAFVLFLRNSLNNPFCVNNLKTKRMKPTFIMKAVVLLLTVLTTAGARAQTTVLNEYTLRSAITDGATIQLGSDIHLSSYLNIEDVIVLVNILLDDNYFINAINVVANGAEGLTFGGYGSGPARLNIKN